MKLLRQAALLLPSAFLLCVLLFLLTHGRDDPGYGTYPFFQEWLGEGRSPAPETRFLLQALVFFAPAYVMTLLFLSSIALAEKALFGDRKRRKPSAFGRGFGSVFPTLFLVAAVLVLWFGEKAALRQAPGALVAPLLAAGAPFAGAALALLPALVLAGPAALLRRTSLA